MAFDTEPATSRAFTYVDGGEGVESAGHSGGRWRRDGRDNARTAEMVKAHAKVVWRRRRRGRAAGGDLSRAMNSVAYDTWEAAAAGAFLDERQRWVAVVSARAAGIPEANGDYTAGCWIGVSYTSTGDFTCNAKTTGEYSRNNYFAHAERRPISRHRRPGRRPRLTAQTVNEKWGAGMRRTLSTPRGRTSAPKERFLPKGQCASMVTSGSRILYFVEQRCCSKACEGGKYTAGATGMPDAG